MYFCIAFREENKRNKKQLGTIFGWKNELVYLVYYWFKIEMLGYMSFEFIFVALAKRSSF